MPAEVPPHWMVYFTVTDTDAEVERVKQLGGSLMAGPMDNRAGRFAVVADPTGPCSAIIAMKPQPPTPDPCTFQQTERSSRTSPSGGKFAGPAAVYRLFISTEGG